MIGKTRSGGAGEAELSAGADAVQSLKALGAQSGRVTDNPVEKSFFRSGIAGDFDEGIETRMARDLLEIGMRFL
jgi:hypothetical protein